MLDGNVVYLNVQIKGKACGRCGGTGAYYVGQHASKGVCYGCSGAGKLYSAQAWKNRAAYMQWRDAVNPATGEKPTLSEKYAAIVGKKFGGTWEVVEVRYEESAVAV
jgi:hypothetical protein